MRQGKETYLLTKSKKIIRLSLVKSEKYTDSFLKVESPTKGMKEQGIRNRLEQGYEQQLELIKQSLFKPRDIKKADKVQQRIGRAKQKYLSITNDRYIKNENPVVNLINNSFLLGLDTDLILKKAELKDKEPNISELKKQLNNPEFKALFSNEKQLHVLNQFRKLSADYKLAFEENKRNSQTKIFLQTSI